MFVVGGGPAGLEAARVAAERGHRVTLAEASDRLGGQFRLAGLQPRRAQILDLIDWYERQLGQLQVEVRYGEYVEADDIEREGADHVIIATGSLPPDGAFQRALPQLDTHPGWRPGAVSPKPSWRAKHGRENACSSSTTAATGKAAARPGSLPKTAMR